MKAQHSPGPWTLCDNGHVEAANGDYVIGFHWDSFKEFNDMDDEHKGNCHLITASPKLLSALQNLCIVFADICERTGYSAGEYYSYRAAQAAIEEALGENNE